MHTLEAIPRFSLSRAALLNYILLFFGTTLILAGIIFFFAYNWDSFPGLAKLGTIQVGFIACTLAATIASKRPILSQTLIFAASIFIGIYLAVFGQVYQTGADPWQLFTLWAALSLPFALIAQTQVQWITFATIAAIGTGRFLYFFLPKKLLNGPAGFTNLVLFPSLFFAAIWLYFERYHRTQNLPKPWSRTLLALILLAVLTLGIFISSHNLTESTNHLFTLTFYTLLAAATFGSWKLFGRSNLDITILGINALAWLLATSWTLFFILLNASVDTMLRSFLMAAYFIIASSPLIFKLRQLTPKKPQDEIPKTEPSPPKIIPILSGIAGWLASIFLIAAFALIVDIQDSEATILVIASFLSAAAITTEYGKKAHASLRSSIFLDQTVNAVSLSAQWLFITSIANHTSLLAQIIEITIICTIYYAFINSTTFRFLTATTFLTACSIFISDSNNTLSLTAIIIPCTIAVGLFFIVLPYLKDSLKNILYPAAYATTLFLFLFTWLTQTAGLFTWFTQTTGQTIAIIIITLTALARATFENRFNPNAKRLLITATLLAAICLFADHTLLWAFTLLAVGLWRQRNTLAILGTLGFAISLSIYYYNLHVTLLTKSGILLVSGLLFLALFWFLELNKNNSHTPSHEVNP